MSTFTDTMARVRAQVGDGLLEPAPPPTVEQLAVGWSVCETSTGDYWPRGGVVVHITPDGAHSAETGEVVDRYTVVRADKAGLHGTSLRADQVDPPEEPNAHTITGVCQEATRQLARQLDRKRAKMSEGTHRHSDPLGGVSSGSATVDAPPAAPTEDEPETPRVVDLMAALEASLAAVKAQRPGGES